MVDFLLAVFAALRSFGMTSRNGDLEKATRAVHATMLTLLVDLPANDFFQRHRDSLRTAMLLGINAWLDSTVLEQKMLMCTVLRLIHLPSQSCCCRPRLGRMLLMKMSFKFRIISNTRYSCCNN